MENKIIQGSEEWKAARQSKIGASEVYTLVHHYCKKELETLGLSLGKELPFRTIQELFMKIKFGATLAEIDPVFAQFGSGMEAYIAHRLGQELPQVKVERSKEFVLNEEIHPLAACSPDGYVEIESGHGLLDFDGVNKIEGRSWGRGVMELKTANFFAGFSANQGAKLQYIFQHQFQMMVMGLKWGIIAAIMPKEKEFDEPFFKGRMYEMACCSEFEIIEKYYDIYHYIYPILPAFQIMIKKALGCFQSDLEAYDTDGSRFPRNSEDLAGLQREKKMWAQLWPEHAGTKQLEAESEIDRLFNERYQAQVEKMFAEQNFDKITNEIYQKVKASGLDKFCEISGTENRMSWIKNGQVRFYRLKEAKE